MGKVLFSVTCRIRRNTSWDGKGLTNGIAEDACRSFNWVECQMLGTHTVLDFWAGRGNDFRSCPGHNQKSVGTVWLGRYDLPETRQMSCLVGLWFAFALNSLPFCFLPSLVLLRLFVFFVLVGQETSGCSWL